MAEVNSTSGAFVLPVYKWDNSLSPKALNFQREMADRKDNAERRKEEAKNWSGEGVEKLHPVYMKPVLDALANLSTIATDYYKANPNGNGLTTYPKYLEAKRKAQEMMAEGTMGTANIKATEDMRFKHPEKLRVNNQALIDAVNNHDYEGLKKTNGGNGLYDLGSGYGPNIDLPAVYKKMADDLTPKQPQEDVVTKNGKEYKVISYPTVTDEAIAHRISVEEMSNDVFSQMPNAAQGAAQYIKQKFAPVQQEFRPYKPDSGSGSTFSLDGSGSNGRFTTATTITETPTPYLSTAPTIDMNPAMQAQIAKAGSLEKVQKLFNDKGYDPNEAKKALDYINMTADEKTKYSPPKLTIISGSGPGNKESSLMVTEKYNIQQIASGENKRLNWPAPNYAIDAKTGRKIRGGGTIEGEIMDVVVGNDKTKGIQQGAWAVIYDEKTSNKTLIPYKDVSDEIQAYTVNKAGKNGWVLPQRGGKVQGAAAPVQKASTTPKQSTATKVSTQSEYDALPKGSQYIGPDGQLRTKN